MSQKNLPNPPYQALLLDAGGYPSKPWADWFRQLYYRVGKSIALTNTELASAVTSPWAIVASRGAPTSITALGGVAYAAAGMTMNFITGLAGPVIVTAAPQIQAGTAVGQILRLIGCNNTNTVELQNSTGLQLTGAIVLGSVSTTGINSTLDLFWDGSQWVETGRT